MWDWISSSSGSAVATMNIGYKAVTNIFKKLGLKAGKYTTTGCKKLNQKRLINANKQCKEKTSCILWGKHEKREDKSKETEGKTYGPGSF